jgi:hypothetical protein
MTPIKLQQKVTCLLILKKNALNCIQIGTES